VQLAGFAAFGGIWLRTRRGRRSKRELDSYDAAAAVLPSLSIIIALGIAVMPLRPEPLGLLVMAHALMTRAVIIPSSARRTFLLGLAAAVPVVVGIHFYDARLASSELPHAWVYTVVGTVWSSASIAISTLMSHTIYGLQEKVREATQLGQYTLETKLGEGGMGIVYRARHAMLRRPTAVKLLPPDRAGADNIARFEREVQLTSLLNHPNTITIYDYGRTHDGVFYYAMEYLDGCDLEELVRRDGPQAPACVVSILEQISGSLAEAHAAGLIHRDIKPGNVILCERGGLPGVVKVVDFGLVRRVTDGSAQVPALSNVNAIIGTPLYLSPEGIARPAAVDARSDLYAAGAVAYFLLTGEHVFEAPSVVEVCGHHLHTSPIPPSVRLDRSLPADLEELVLSCLQKNPEHRPQSAADLAERLSRLDCRSEWNADERMTWWLRVQSAARDNDRHSSEISASRTLAIDFSGRAAS